MNLLDCLLPACPPEPKEARTVYLETEPPMAIATPAEIARRTRWRKKNRDRLNAEKRRKYRVSRGLP